LLKPERFEIIFIDIEAIQIQMMKLCIWYAVKSGKKRSCSRLHVMANLGNGNISIKKGIQATGLIFYKYFIKLIKSLIFKFYIL
jgi:hypothetical protein